MSNIEYIINILKIYQKCSLKLHEKYLFDEISFIELFQGYINIKYE